MDFLKFYKNNTLKPTIKYLVILIVSFSLGSIQTFAMIRDMGLLKDPTTHFPLPLMFVFLIFFVIGGVLGSFLGSFIKFKKEN